MEQYSKIDKSSPIPAYQQIATDLTERIAQEEWALGERLNSENELAEYYGVARVTLRQAMSLLEQKRLIVKRQGRGIFVTAIPKIFTLNIQFPTFDPGGDSPDNGISTRIIETIRVDNPEKHVRRNLHTDETTPVVYIQRLFSIKSMVIGLNRAWFPAHMVPGLDTEGTIGSSISKTLALRYDFEIANIENFVESVKLNVADANLLGSTYDASALRIDSIHLLKDNTPIEYARTIWLSDYTRLRFNVSK